MADATERWSGPTVRRGVDSSSASRIWDVIDADNERNAIEAAGIARLGDSHPRYSALRVRDISGRQVAPTTFEVTASYDDNDSAGRQSSSSSSDQQDSASDKLSRLLRIRWTPLISEEEIDSDIDGNPLVNSAGETFQNPVTETFAYIQLYAVRWEREYDVQFALDMINSTNINTFAVERKAVIRPYQGKIIDISPSQEYEIGQQPLLIRYQFEFREFGFKKNVLDQGEQKYSIVNDVKTLKEIRMKGDAMPINFPVRLAGNGVPVDAAKFELADEIPAGKIPDYAERGPRSNARVTRILYRTLKERDWSLLGL